MKAMTQAISSWTKLLTGCVFSVFIVSISALAQTDNFKPSSEDDFPAFPDDVTPLIPLRSQMPGDFFSPAKAALKERTPNRLQHDFDIYSWETFIAISWPANPDGSPKDGDPTIPGYFTYPNGTVWENWMPADTVFREDAKEPIEWGKVPLPGELYGASDETEESQKRLKVEVAPADSKGIQSLQEAQAKKVRSISWIGTNFAGAVHGQNTKTLKEVEQALGTGRLIDSNGHFVRYEVLMNQDVYRFIVDNRLYDQDVQEKYVSLGKRIVFPIGTFEDPNAVDGTGRPSKTKNVGSIVVKAGWKLLNEKEYKSNRFYATKAVTQLAGRKEGKSLVYFGLIALHIAHKSADVGQWTWSTFEHDDNCPDIKTVDDNSGRERDYSFFDRAVFDRIGYVRADGYPAVNVLSDLVSLPKPISEPLEEKHHSRLVRLVPLTRDVTAINEQFKGKFDKFGKLLKPGKLSNTVWKNYSLVSTQWPLEPAGVFLGRGEIAQKIARGEKSASGKELEPGGRERRNYADLDGDVERYNSGDFAMDDRRLTGLASGLRDRSPADKQLGFPAPRTLANAIIETSLQGTIKVDEDGRPSFRSGIEHGTSSCMHCHGDAKTFGTGRPSDMSFLLSRAKKKSPTKPPTK
jgi:hypothetical protein